MIFVKRDGIIDSIMKLYSCDKTVIRFFPEGAAFLKGYTTNTAEAPRNAFVDIQGKIVAVFDQFKKSQDEVWAVVETPFVERLMNHLKKYLFLSQTRAEILPKKVYWNIENKQLILSDETLKTNVSEHEFKAFRLKNKIPLQGVDFDEEMILNLDDESLVSYTKGCYLGQEIVARVHYRSKPPKKLVVKNGEFVFEDNKA